MGHAVLIETIRMAAYYVNHSNGCEVGTTIRLSKIKEAQNCYAYVQGTGLQMIVARFGMDYDTDRIRDTFNYCVRRSA